MAAFEATWLLRSRLAENRSIKRDPVTAVP
jgi:hypothetical protein